MALLDLAPEIFDLILSACIPTTRECRPNVHLRLVCRTFDERVSRRILKFYEVEAPFSKFDFDWPQDSVDWLLRTRVLMHNGRVDVKGGAVYKLMSNSADALYRLLLEKQGEAPSMHDLTGLTCKVVLAYWQLRDLMRLKDIDTEIVNTHPLELLPCLAYIGDIQLITDFLSSVSNNDNHDAIRLKVNYKSRLFGDALYAAAAANQPQTVSWLLSNGAKIYPQGGRWGSPLGAALQHRDAPDAFSILLAEGAIIEVPEPDYPVQIPAGGKFPDRKTIRISSQSGVPAESCPRVPLTMIRSAIARNQIGTLMLLFDHPDVKDGIMGEFLSEIEGRMRKTGEEEKLKVFQARYPRVWASWANWPLK